MKKRILAALLSAVMVFTMIPFMGVTAYAENTKGPGDEYVSLPITIRDYAADGMLFECNEENTQGPQNVGATVVQPNLKITSAAGGPTQILFKTDMCGIHPMVQADTSHILWVAITKKEMIYVTAS